MSLRFLVDAQLPPSLCKVFIENNYEAIHTTDLPEGNNTKDNEIIKISIENKLVVISKDLDFWDSFALKKEPHKLILVKTGNISTKELKQVFKELFSQIITQIEQNDIIVITREGVSHF